jgi:hypothetical protein
MKAFSPPLKAGVQRALMALTLTTACSATWALPVFTLDPAAAGLAGSSVTADNIIISDYSTVRINEGTGSFTDTGFLSFSNFQLTGAFVNAVGLNDTYGLYIQFEGSGSQTPGDPTLVQTMGNFTDLTYTLYGYNGPPASFGFDGDNNPTTTAAGAIVLATGALVEGNVSTSPAAGPTGAPSFTPNAAATLTFDVAAGMEGFFADPNPFYNLAFSAFTNTVSQVELFDGGFRIRQGGGAINFDATAPIPEPGTYALMLAGLAAVGTVVRRRRKV